MANLKVSFCISSYGRLDRLKACIKSIKKQSYINYEILVGSPKDIEPYLDTDITYIKSDDHIGKTRNILKSSANGSWLVFLDEDVELESNDFLIHFLNSAEITCNDVYGGFYNTDKKSSLLDRAYNMTCNLWVLRGNLKGPQVLGGIYILKGSMFPDFFDGYSFGGEEYPYFSELIKRKCKIAVSKQLNVLHRPKHSFMTFIKRAWLHGKYKPIDKVKGQRVNLFMEYKEGLLVKTLAATYFATVYISQFFNKFSSLLKFKNPSYTGK